MTTDELKNESSKRILLIDDEKTLIECIAYFIRKRGFIVEVAENAQIALLLINSLRPDVIFIDISLPDMDGYELAGKIRSLLCCCNTMLIACSGYDPIQEKVNVFDDFLIKPLDIEELLQFVSDDVSSNKNKF